MNRIKLTRETCRLYERPRGQIGKRRAFHLAAIQVEPRGLSWLTGRESKQKTIALTNGLASSPKTYMNNGRRACCGSEEKRYTGCGI